MRKILEELKKLDPKTFELLEDISIGIHGYGILKNPNIRTIGHIIQGEVQKAIEARQWLWTVTKEDSWSDEAKAGTPYQAIIFNENIDCMVDRIFADSPAKAILTAYIRSLT